SWHPDCGWLYQCDLTRLKTNAVAMVRIRDFVRRAEQGYCVALANDDELFEQFSRLLDSNRWRICSLVSVDQPTTHAEVESQCPSFDEPSPPTRQTAPPPPVAQADSDNSTFPSNHDATAQTLALVEAAQSGVPFCEECAKLRLSQSSERSEPPVAPVPAAPPETSGPPSNPDAVAQAEVLVEAAQSGAPFCEECEKQRQPQGAVA
ncbi:MAG: hypothetical protein NTY19_04440, partial [Planctomycetota bacterium]|nr:hypothetical protein [Planctomycetota bacterium]